MARQLARQLEREAAAAPDLALEVDAPAVRLHDVAHDREAEPGGAGSPPSCRLGEALEDALALLRRDARPGVGHARRARRRPSARRRRSRSARRAACSGARSRPGSRAPR